MWSIGHWYYSHSDDTDLLTWTGTKTDERAVDGQTGAKLILISESHALYMLKDVP